MRKRFPIVLVLILTVLVAGTFCCCLTNTVQAQEETLPPCHSQAGASQEDHNNQECECDQIQSLAAQKVFELHKADTQPVDVFDINILLSSIIQIEREDAAQICLSYLKSSHNEPPLYLILSNLRL